MSRSEPQPTGDIAPVLPLSEAEQLVWDRLAPALIRQRVLTANDADALTSLCQTQVRYAEAMANVNERGAWIDEVRGHGASQYDVSVINPAWRVVMDSMAQMMKLWARFGMTPSDRQNLSVEAGPEDASTAAAFLT